MTKEISNSDDYLDIRNIIERVEELHEIATDEAADRDERTHADNELAVLQALLDDLRGNGGDHQWQGDWYPVTLIRHDCFRDYAMELAEDIGAINRDATWPNNCIDWEQATRELKMDYNTVEFDGVTYWYR